MQFKLLLLTVCVAVAVMVCLVEAGFESSLDCGHVAKDRCKSCCSDGVYTGYKWKRFGGSRDKICVCKGESGTKDSAHRNDYSPEYTGYLPPPHLADINNFYPETYY